MPRVSPRAEVAQVVGDTRIALVYHRPLANKRKIFGAGKDFLVPYGQVWRTGANDATIFETSEDITVNGSRLPAGKYSLFSIPDKDEWTLIFNKVTGQWGTEYKEAEDFLRVKAKPQPRPEYREAMMFSFGDVSANTTELVLTWEKLRLPIIIDVGDVQSRVLAKAKKAIAGAADNNAQFTSRVIAANYVLDNKISASYPEATTWVDEALKMRETFGSLRARARLAAAMNNFKDAATYGDKAITVGKAATPPINSEFMANFEKEVAEWKKKN